MDIKAYQGILRHYRLLQTTHDIRGIHGYLNNYIYIYIKVYQSYDNISDEFYGYQKPKKNVQESRVPYFCTGHKRHGRKQVLILYGMVGLVNTFRKA